MVWLLCSCFDILKKKMLHPSLRFLVPARMCGRNGGNAVREGGGRRPGRRRRARREAAGPEGGRRRGRKQQEAAKAQAVNLQPPGACQVVPQGWSLRQTVQDTR